MTKPDVSKSNIHDLAPDLAPLSGRPWATDHLARSPSPTGEGRGQNAPPTSPPAHQNTTPRKDHEMITITATGRPITQGSKTRTRWGMRDDNGQRLHPWRDTVTNAAIEAINGADPILDPVAVAIRFQIARPAGHYGTGRNADKLKPSAPPLPIGRNSGDIDKLCRAILDSLTVAKVWGDDSQVATLSACKVYVGRHEREGAEITVRTYTQVIDDVIDEVAS